MRALRRAPAQRGDEQANQQEERRQDCHEIARREEPQRTLRDHETDNKRHEQPADEREGDGEELLQARLFAFVIAG